MGGFTGERKTTQRTQVRWRHRESDVIGFDCEPGVSGCQCDVSH